MLLRLAVDTRQEDDTYYEHRYRSEPCDRSLKEQSAKEKSDQRTDGYEQGIRHLCPYMLKVGTTRSGGGEYRGIGDR